MKTFDEIIYNETTHLSGRELLNLLRQENFQKPVYFAHRSEGYHSPKKYPVNSWHSWRGSYSYPSLGTDNKEVYTVDQVVSNLETDFFGRKCYGYKGGEYIMYDSDPIWADDFNIFEEKAVIGVESTEDAVYIVTDHKEY